MHNGATLHAGAPHVTKFALNLRSNTAANDAPDKGPPVLRFGIALPSASALAWTLPSVLRPKEGRLLALSAFNMYRAHMDTYLYFSRALALHDQHRRPSHTAKKQHATFSTGVLCWHINTISSAGREPHAEKQHTTFSTAFVLGT